VPNQTHHSPAGHARVLGYAAAVGAGTLWGTTGPISTALYAEGAALTGVGFWRVAVASLALLAVGLVRRDLLRVDRRGLLAVGLGGGALVALFEVTYQYAIAGVGVAGAATLLYTAPLIVAVLGHALLREKLTPARVSLALLVLVAAVAVRTSPWTGPRRWLPGVGAAGALFAWMGVAPGSDVLAHFFGCAFGFGAGLVVPLAGSFSKSTDRRLQQLTGALAGSALALAWAFAFLSPAS